MNDEEESLLLDHEDTHDTQSIPVHISFDLEDKPKELMGALYKLEVS